MTPKIYRLFATLLFTACSSAGDSTSESGETGTSGTTGGSGVCGDGVLDPGEACEVAAPGCDAECHVTGETAWTLRVGAPDDRTTIYGVAVDPTGQIVVFGEKLHTPGGEPIHSTWLLALDPSGDERWRKEFPQDSPSLTAAASPSTPMAGSTSSSAACGSSGQTARRAGKSPHPRARMSSLR